MAGKPLQVLELVPLEETAPDRDVARAVDHQSSAATAAQRDPRPSAPQREENERPPWQARGASPIRRASERKPRPEAEPDDVSAGPDAAPARDRQPRLKYLLAAGAAALASIFTVAWLMASPAQSKWVPKPIAPAAAPSPNPSSLPTPPGGEQAVAGAKNPEGLLAEFETRVQEFKLAGNWNVLVLYASEWTRKEPNNASAWHNLSLGYFKLNQIQDALDAASKAVQLAPGDPLLWSNLGQVNLALARLPEAETAFGRALAVSPDDAVALCGAALVAQKRERPTDANAIASRVQAPTTACGPSVAARAAPVASGSAAPSADPPVAR